MALAIGRCMAALHSNGEFYSVRRGMAVACYNRYKFIAVRFISETVTQRPFQN